MLKVQLPSDLGKSKGRSLLDPSVGASRSPQEVVCPNCQASFSVTDALVSEIESRVRTQVEGQIQLRDQELERMSQDLELERKKAEKALEQVQKDFQKQAEKEKSEIERRLKTQFERQVVAEVVDLKNQLEQRDAEIQKTRELELDLRRSRREVEEKEKFLELELERRLDLQKSHLEEGISKRMGEESRLRIAEKDKQLDEMRRQIEDLKRKSEQGSQQTQGEVLEDEIEALLRSMFPQDEFFPVPKGMRGGDLIQKVRSTRGQVVGQILWEAKRTKAWVEGWIEKLKEDQRGISAEFAVIVTQVLPKASKGLGLHDGVWVSDFRSLVGIATALRMQLLGMDQVRGAVSGKNEKMDYLYGYLTGTQFKQRVEVIVEAFRSMSEDLEKEKRTIQKTWAVREQQMSRVIASTVSMYGDIQGIVGKSLPKIDALELE